MQRVRTDCVGFFALHLAPSHGFENFDAVARRQAVSRKGGARDHVAIDRDGDVSPVEPQRVDQSRHRAVGWNHTTVSVYEY